MPGNRPLDRATATSMLVDSMNGSARSASKLLPLVYEELRARAFGAADPRIVRS